MRRRGVCTSYKTMKPTSNFSHYLNWYRNAVKYVGYSLNGLYYCVWAVGIKITTNPLEPEI